MPQLKRLPLGEITDQPWCPKVIRNAVTDFLQYSINHWGQYTPLLPTLCYFLQRVDSHHIGESFRIVLTDRYPNLAAFRLAHNLSGGVIEFREEPLDAGDLPEGLTGFRTLFSSFHHFPPAQAKRVLQNAVDSGQGIGILR